MNEDVNKQAKKPLISQPSSQAQERPLMETNSSGIKRDHEYSDSDKEVSSNAPDGILKNKLQIVPAKQNVVVSQKVTNKKGKRGKGEA